MSSVVAVTGSMSVPQETHGLLSTTTLPSPSQRPHTCSYTAYGSPMGWQGSCTHVHRGPDCHCCPSSHTPTPELQDAVLGHSTREQTCLLPSRATPTDHREPRAAHGSHRQKREACSAQGTPGPPHGRSSRRPAGAGQCFTDSA